MEYQERALKYFNHSWVLAEEEVINHRWSYK